MYFTAIFLSGGLTATVACLIVTHAASRSPLDPRRGLGRLLTPIPPASPTGRERAALLAAGPPWEER